MKRENLREKVLEEITRKTLGDNEDASINRMNLQARKTELSFMIRDFSDYIGNCKKEGTGDKRYILTQNKEIRNRIEGLENGNFAYEATMFTNTYNNVLQGYGLMPKA